MSQQTQHFYEFGEYRIEAAERLLRRDDNVVSLPPKAIDLLLVMLESNGRVMTKEDLMAQVWADTFVEEANLSHNVFLLRKALGDAKNGAKYIETIPRRGYRFAADLTQNAADTNAFFAREQTRSRIVIEEEIEVDGALHTQKKKGDKISKRKPTAAIAVVLLLVIGSLLAYRYKGVENEINSVAAPVESIAVMPFANESGNSEIEYLSDGVTEALIGTLSQLPNLKVKARSSVFRYKGKDATPQTIGKELNVQAILNGHVVQHGDQLTFSLELIDAKTENVIWSDKYNRKQTDLVSLQNEIARDVSNKLQVKLSSRDEQKLAKHYPKNAEAYPLYLKGRYFWNKFTPADLQKAAEYFNQALTLDSDYALAYAGLADTYGASATNGWTPPKEAYRKGKEAAKKALEIDETLAPAHVALGAISMFSDFDWEVAEREYKHAIELDPNYELTYELYSYLLSALGRPDEALTMAQRGLGVDPLSALLSDDVAWAYYLERRYDQSIQQLQKTLELESDRAEAHLGLGNAYELKGRYEEAIAEYQKAISLSERTSNTLGFLGHAYAASGKRNEAIKIVNEMKGMSKQKYISPYDLAILYTGLGEKDKALEQLNTAYEERAGWVIYLKVEPVFDDLRPDPRFAALLRRLGLEN